ncbi:MAG TPA: hypothetical protein VJT31_19985, partial [Rugosimonospora sp.]|nr:hypothetical protein [Rugosimonospora sp.]
MRSEHPYLCAVVRPDSPVGQPPLAAGCLLAPDLVLTWAQALPDRPGELRVALPDPRHPDGAVRYAARIAVTGQDTGAGVDVTLLTLDDPEYAPPEGFVPPRPGVFTSSSPQWTEACLLTPGCEVPAEISPLSWRRPHRWDLRLRPDVAARAASAPPPPGAPLYVGDLLVGLARPEPDGSWTGVPIAAVLADPQVRATVVERTGRPIHLAPVELQGLVAPWTPAGPPVLAADLLDPARALTPFVDPTGQLERLVAWCRNGAGLAGRLVIGAPGAGKTRLTRELAGRLSTDGWLVGELAAASPNQTWCRHLGRTDRPVLLLADPAEQYAGAAAVIAQALRVVPLSHPVRLLVVAREAGDWWRRWRTSLGECGPVFDADPVHVPVIPADVAAPLHRAARAALSGPLRDMAGTVPADPALATPTEIRRRLTDHHPDTDGVAVAPEPPLSAGTGRDTPLAVQLTVLHAVLAGDSAPGGPAATDGTGGGRAGGDPVVTVLADAGGRFARLGERLSADARPYWSAAVDLAVAVQPAPATALDLLGALGVAHPLSEAVRAELADRLRDACPPRDPGDRAWGAPLPDALRDRWLVAASQRPGLREVLARCPDRSAGPVLVALARAAWAGEPVTARLTAAIAGRPAVLGPVAIRVATGAAPLGPLVAAIRDVLEREDGPGALHTALANAIPAGATHLAELAVHVWDRLVENHRRAADTGDRTARARLAGDLVELSTWWSAAGGPPAALSAAAEAAIIYAELDGGGPAVGHARSWRAALHVQAACQAQLGDLPAAIDAQRRSVELSAALAEGDPAYAVWQAGDTAGLAGLLLDSEQVEQAVAAYEQAAAILRQRRRDNPAAYPLLLVEVLCGLSDALVRCHRSEAAAEAMAAVVDEYTTLAEQDPATYLHPLAAALEVSSARLAAASRAEDAVAAAERAVLVYQRLAQRHRDRQLPEHTEALRRLADRYAAAGRHQEA